MGELLRLRDHLADRSRPSARSTSAFFFDLACPFSYLAAERVERVLGEADWVPVASFGMRAVGGEDSARFRREAEQRAVGLRLPLVWPDRLGAGVPSALRAASFAAECGAGARFALAAARLAFCGGFDLEDPEILAEAAAAAGVPLDPCLAAAGDTARDEVLLLTATGLRRRGARTLPAIRLGPRLLDGPDALARAGTMLRLQAEYGTPLAPAS